MMKKYLNIFVGGTIVLTTIFTSCKKETEMQPKNTQNLNSSELLSIENSQYGSWLKFSNRNEFVEYSSQVKSILETSTNSDSALDLLDASNQFISLRKFYNDTVNDNRPELGNDELAHGTVAAFVNYNGIFQIEDTIILMTKHYIFSINNGDASTLTQLDEFANLENINTHLLPNNVTAYKLTRKLDESESNSASFYDISYTEARDYWIGSSTRYKLVAGYICYSFPYPVSNTEYYSSSKFEMGKRKYSGSWKWIAEWALPIRLNCHNTFRVRYGNISLLHNTGSLQEIFGQRAELRQYYWFENRSPYVYYFTPINMYSIHESVRPENSLYIQITKYF